MYIQDNVFILLKGKAFSTTRDSTLTEMKIMNQEL